MIGVDILLRLILAHIIVDFFLQTKEEVAKKQKKDFTAHIIHGAIHAVIGYIAVCKFNYWEILPILFILHVMIDYIKACSRNSTRVFIIDQVLHILGIIFLWLYITDQFYIFSYTEDIFTNSKFLIICIGYMLMLKPVSVAMALFTAKWRDGNSLDGRSLQNAGMWIGYIERVMILTFVLIDSYELIGFLLAAKSIFRFGELNNAKDIKTTEYVLIGTFTSFFTAIITGIVINILIK